MPNPPHTGGQRPANSRVRLPRRHLVQRLDEALVDPQQPALGFSRRLSLVSGPAGFGKTTVIDLWLSALERRAGGRPHIVWLTLSPDTGADAAQFASVLSREFQSISPEGNWDIPISGLPLVPVLSNRLLAALDRRDHPILLVIDDYHLVSDPTIHEFMTDLLARLPTAAHLVITSRSDPPFMLSRLRVGGLLTELRARDLRLTAEEAASFLNDLMGLDLPADEVAQLEQRTEGWVAGLQLAAYSLSLQDDKRAFLDAFTGDDRFIADYLIEEVLSRQSPDRLSFLLQTSILDRLSAELCDALTGRNDSRAILQSLEADNLFLTPLDNRRQWYRFHRLFADLLHERLLEQNEPIANLHRRAAVWFQAHRHLPEAVEHALAGGDEALAMDIMILAAPGLFATNHLGRLTRWGRTLPDTALTARPRLILALMWAWLATGNPTPTERLVRLFETAVGVEVDSLCHSDQTPDRAVEAGLIEAAAAQARIYVDQLANDETLTLCRCALARLERLSTADGSFQQAAYPDIPATWPPYFNTLNAVRPVLLFNMGLALKFNNEIDEAIRTMAAADEQAHRENNSHLVALAGGHLADIQRIQGRVRAAIETCRRGLAFLRQLSPDLSPLAGLLLVEQGCSLYEMNRTVEAEQLWQQGIELAEPWGNWESLLPAYLGLARLRRYRGDRAGAIDALDSLVSLTPAHLAVVGPVASAYRRWFLAEDGVENDEVAGPVEPVTLPYFREIIRIAQARTLLAGHKWSEAASILNSLVDARPPSGRHGRLLEIRLLQALAADGLGRTADALHALSLALDYGRREGIVQPFLEAGEKLVRLLGKLPAHNENAPFGRQLRGLIPAPRPGTSGDLIDLGPDDGLLEPLSDRETEVLAFIAAGLSNKEIADRLFVTEGTVKNHAHSIYGKLGVTARTQAVARGRRLGLLDS